MPATTTTTAATTAMGDQPDTGRWGRIPAWWLDHPDLEADGLAVLAALATFADEHGVCWPSQSTLAAKLKRSRPTINRILQRLDDMGLVSIEHRRGRDGARLSCRYRLRVAQNCATQNPAPQNPRIQDDPPAAQSPAEFPVPAVDRPDSPTNGPCSSASQEQLQPEQNPDSPASRRRAPAQEVPVGWLPDAGTMVWAKARFGDVDLERHVEGFVLRCQAHGYHYRDIGAAWRTWLVEDATAGKLPVIRNRSLAAVPPATRFRETAAAQRVDAWAAAAMELRRRSTTQCQPWS